MNKGDNQNNKHKFHVEAQKAYKMEGCEIKLKRLMIKSFDLLRTELNEPIAFIYFLPNYNLNVFYRLILSEPIALHKFDR